MGLFPAQCPVARREQRWIETSMAWFRDEFGPEYLRRGVVLPTEQYFPGPHDESAETIRATVIKVCGYADVDPARLTLEFYGDSAETDLARAAGLTTRSRGAAGHYRRVDGRPVIGIDRTLGATPDRLIATVAHELGHVRLLDEGRISVDRVDNEPLTDLLTVYLGLGIFTANARFDYRQDNQRQSTANLGYLTEPMFGYGLACYAWLRNESRPDWLRHVDTNPRSYAKRGLRYLTANAEPGQLPRPSG
jgi:hypothetical protein